MMLRPTKRTGWPTLDQLWGLATVVLVALRVQLTPIAPNDFWWHMATGRWIIGHGAIPATDHFSYTRPGEAYFNQPWLAQVFMYGGYQLGGAALLELVQAAVIALTFGLLYRLCHRIGVGVRLAAIITLCGALVAMDNWQIRPQTYVLPLFVGTLTVLEAWRATGKAKLWLLPLLMVVWVNIHGTFTLLIVLGGCYWLGAVLDRWLPNRPAGSIRSWRECWTLVGWGVASLVAMLINPYGWRILVYVSNLLRNQSVSRLVTEWASPLRDLGSPMTLVFLALFAIFVGIFVWRWRSLAPTDVLLALAFGALAFQSVRNILWFGTVAAVVTAHGLATLPRKPQPRRIELLVMNRLIAGILLGLVVATLPWWKESLGLPPELGRLLSSQTPVAATARLEQLPQRPQHLFHEMGFGSYLIWAAPEQPVFSDPRIELYSFEQWRDYIVLGQGREIDQITAKYGLDGLLVNPVNQVDLLKALKTNPRWQQVFATDEAVYFGKK